MNTCSNQPLYQGSAEKVTPYMADIYDSASLKSSQNVPFPRMGYNLDEQIPVSSEGLMNDNMMMNKNNLQNLSKLPAGMRLPMMATKGKMGASPKQLFDSDNESIYDSDGEYQQMVN
jgi:hypothetical protein